MVIAVTALLILACLTSLAGIVITLRVSYRQAARSDAQQLQTDEILRLLGLYKCQLERLDLQKSVNLPAVTVSPLTLPRRSASEVVPAPIFSTPQAPEAPSEPPFTSWGDVVASGEARRAERGAE